MATCLVISDKELKSYTDLGITRREVERDYMETGELRSPMAIKHKLKLREEQIPGVPTEQNTEYQEFMNESEDFDKKAAEGWTYKLTKALGVEAEIISREQAKNIHASKEQAYDNEDAFFTDGKVHFVEGTLTPESVVHEFSHPLIKSLDPAVKEKLYQDLMNDPNLNGQAIVDEVAKQYGENFDIERAKEEVLVRALTKMTLQEENTPNTDNWLGKILYAIRQALRKLIGKRVNVRNLDGNTTLKDLAKMLAQGDVMDLQKDLITSSDVIEYFKNRQEFVDKFDTLLQDQNAQGYGIAQNMINATMDVALKQKKDIITNPDLFPLREVLLLEYGENNRGLLDEIISNLKDDAQLDRSKVVESIIESEDFEPTVEKIRERLLNLSKSLHKVDELFDTMMELETITDKNGNKKTVAKKGSGQLGTLEGLDSKEKIDRLIYYKKFMMQWTGKYSEDVYKSQGVVEVLYAISRNYEDGHPLKDLAKRLKDKADAISDKINELQRESVKDYMYEIMEPAGKQLMDEWQEGLKTREKATQKVRDRYYLDFHNMTEAQYKRYKELHAKGQKTREYRQLRELWLVGNELDREKIDALIEGEFGDAKHYEGMYESMSQNTDPAIQSVYKHMQALKAKWEAKALNFHNAFVQDIAPDIKKVGGKFQNRGALGRKMGFKDTKAIKGPNGTIEKVEEWTFLNPWRDFRFDHSQLINNVEQAAKAYAASNSDKDELALIQAERELQLWKNKYMHQQYAVEYYETLDLLVKDEVGRSAKKRRDAIFNEMNQFVEDNEDGRYDEVIEQLKFKLKELSSTTDILGNKKTGIDLQIAERLKEYSEARKDFFEEDEMPGEFQREYDEYSEHLIYNEKLSKDSDAYKSKMEDWLRRNTRVVLKSSVYENRKSLIDEKQNLLRLLNEENRKIFDDTADQSLINEQANIIKDNGNQPDGNEATAEARKKVLEAHKNIEEKRKNFITRSGLTKADNARLKELRQIWKNNGERFPNNKLQSEHDALIKKQAETSTKLGLNEVTLKRLKEIDAQLREMGGKTPTDHYMHTMIELIREANGEQEFLTFIETEDMKVSMMEEAYNIDFVIFLNSEQGKKLIEENDKLRQFVEQNHYEDVESDLRPTNLWYASVSNDPYDYRTKRIRKADGTSELIEIDNTFRIPASRFYQRKVKEKYRTKEVVGETVNNRSDSMRWLPKEESSNRYRNAEYYDLKENDPETFEFMEKIKEHLLKAQEGKADKDKIYLGFPRTAKTKTENIGTGNVLKWSRRWKEFTQGREDDVFDIKSTANKMVDDKSLAITSSITTGVGVPVMGVTENDNFGRRMNIDDISTDILKTIPEYMASLFMKEAALESNSYARMVQDVVNRTEIDERNWNNNAKTLIEKSHSMDMADQFDRKKGAESTRKKVLDALVERELDGIFLTGKGSNSVILNKTLSAMTSRASKINFNWNIYSAIVNWNQMKITGITHAAASEDFNPIDYVKGEQWAFKTARKISTQLRRRTKVKSLEEQMVNFFDAISGRAMETLGDNLSRTIMGDAIEGKSPQKIRKWLEMQGTIQNFAALMYNKKVTITDANGTRKIPYINAFELNAEGNLQTKEGVEADYAVTFDANGEVQMGKKVVEQKEYMQNVIMKINGAFSKQDTPLIARNVFFKQLLFLKKHVIPLGVKSYQFSKGFNEQGGFQLKKRVNYTTGKSYYGYHIQTLRYLRDLLESALNGKFLMFTKAERAAFVFTAVQMVIGYILLPRLYNALTFFWIDPDDPDEREKVNYNAMKTRSGYFEALFTEDQDGYHFDAEGFALNAMSYIMRKTMDEYNAVNLFHPSGFVEYLTHGTSQSVSAVQTLKFVYDAIGMATGTKSSTPQQDSGPYWFQKQGAQYEFGLEYDEEGAIINDPWLTVGGKWFETMFDFVGANSKVIAPVETQQAYEAGRRLKGGG